MSLPGLWIETRTAWTHGKRLAEKDAALGSEEKRLPLPGLQPGILRAPGIRNPIGIYRMKSAKKLTPEEIRASRKRTRQRYTAMSGADRKRARKVAIADYFSQEESSFRSVHSRRMPRAERERHGARETRLEHLQAVPLRCFVSRERLSADTLHTCFT